ncbi:MAG TPA: gamma-glutamyltransferase [Solirubrobacteraceae bacterium]|jgi:gamma-glutamyltranspeptidase/glutathione hydrolase|nr:gamma-glutamyltransferase [Solirubrobacteraceae bacterium]
MSTAEKGVVAAGHPLTAQAGAEVLRGGGNAVDAAVAAMLASFAAEPLLTGLGAGGYMMVAGGGQEPALLDFFVEAPARAQDGTAAELDAVDVSFGDAMQVFYIGPASCGVYGTPAGVCEAAARWGTIDLAELAAPAAKLAREGVLLNAGQAYIVEILADLLQSTPECAQLWAPHGRVLREGELLRNPELGDALERLGRDGAKPFYSGDIAEAVCTWLAGRGGSIGPEQLGAYRAIEREPLRMRYRDRDVLTNPPPSAGGTLLAYSLALLDEQAAPPSLEAVILAMEAAQSERTPAFVQGLGEEGFLERFLSSRLGATTHISVLDSQGSACSVTCTNGEGSGVVVPGTGIHLNNVMGEEDLSPLGFHSHPAGRRMPSMMAPSVVMRDGDVELVLGSAGSNRIRSALLQTIVGVVDRDLRAPAAVDAPRVHFEGGIVYHEPGVEPLGSSMKQREVVRFHEPNLFFGGVQAVQRCGDELVGAGDPRRGGVAVAA